MQLKLQVGQIMNIIKRYFSYLKSIWSQESKGFGDTFKKIASSFGIKSCSACEERRKKWNEKLSYEKIKRLNKNVEK